MFRKIVLALSCVSLILAAGAASSPGNEEEARVHTLAESQAVGFLSESPSLIGNVSETIRENLAAERAKQEQHYLDALGAAITDAEAQIARIAAEEEAARIAAEQEAARRAQEEAERRRAAEAATTTTSPPAVTQAPRTGNCGGWENLVSAYFGAETATACRVMMCESGGDPTVHNRHSTASGLWQFLDGTWESTTGKPGPAANYSAEEQTAAAKKLRDRSGWSQWSCY